MIQWHDYKFPSFISPSLASFPFFLSPFLPSFLSFDGICSKKKMS